MNWLRVKNNAELRLDPNAEEKYYQGKHRIVGKITYMDTGLPVTCRKTFKGNIGLG
ncbi:hypothetical protein FC20_GL000237 [Lactobacillus equicursoris DSM 19284 = JCM 14600 = CIP 110162]|uniref:Uncharacterized protein n=1 Tax=Lactobacillus equicursoris DSM 19284 = JCM 14600 = CIP 110162 TaxID=1293597 RepID=A0A0R1MC88_9LACO|nr:hypothetical protein FC20_GL000237 [Lactobacillus equicursoris DSM 19284 = JCM 14600 = CIP 110162]